jgi:hypothetical protein
MDHIVVEWVSNDVKLACSAKPTTSRTAFNLSLRHLTDKPHKHPALRRSTLRPHKGFVSRDDVHHLAPFDVVNLTLGSSTAACRTERGAVQPLGPALIVKHQKAWVTLGFLELCNSSFFYVAPLYRVFEPWQTLHMSR